MCIFLPIEGNKLGNCFVGTWDPSVILCKMAVSAECFIVLIPLKDLDR